MATDLASSSPIPDGLNFLFPNFVIKNRNQAMLFDKTLIEHFNTDIGFKRKFCLTVKNVCNEEKLHLSTSIRILESVYVTVNTI